MDFLSITSTVAVRQAMNTAADFLTSSYLELN